MGSKHNILIIDSDCNSNQYISQLLQNDNYMVCSTTSGVESQSMITSICPDMIILDSELPDADVTDIVRNTRTWSNIPIIITSFEHNISNMVTLLNIGADDFILKPFCDKELLTRIQTTFRNHHFPHNDLKYVHENLTISFDKRLVTLDGNVVHLTNTEYKILSYIAEHNGKLVTYPDLMTHVWGPYMDNNTIILRVNMTHIRKKIETDPSNPIHVITEPGIGYRMNEYKG